VRHRLGAQNKQQKHPARTSQVATRSIHRSVQIAVEAQVIEAIPGLNPVVELDSSVPHCRLDDIESVNFGSLDFDPFLDRPASTHKRIELTSAGCLWHL